MVAIISPGHEKGHNELGGPSKICFLGYHFHVSHTV